MGYKLPTMKYADGIRQHVTMTFGGINHNLSAIDGEIYDAQNLSTDLYPVMGSRKPRYKIAWTGTTGIGAWMGRVCRTTSKKLLEGWEGVELAALPESGLTRKLIPMGNYIIIMPDRLVYNYTTEELKPMSASVEALATFTDGTIYGEAATGNTIHANVDWEESFKAGDAVSIKSTTNTLSAIIREIDGYDLHFDENIFTTTETAEAVKIERKAPYFDKVFEHKNRLWGYQNNTIYASKLGDPFNWEFFDGTAEDSYTLELWGGNGFLTGGVSYTYPTFFKEDRIYRIYGEKPSNFQTTETIALGEKTACDSAVVVGNVLYYLSTAGVMAYTGGTPSLIHRALGTDVMSRGTAGTDGLKYYLYARWGATERLFVFDPRYNVWQTENVPLYGVQGFAWWDETLVMLMDNEVWFEGYNPLSVSPVEVTKETLTSYAEFGDFIEGDTNSKTTTKLLLRFMLGTDATLNVKISFDGGAWEDAKTLSGTDKRSEYLPIVPRRCDHYRIKLTGAGEWALLSMTRESASGSQLKTV